MPKLYRLTAPDGSNYESEIPGEFGGYTKEKIYGRLDSSSAVRALPKGYAQHRVFFKDETAAIAAGYRPCGICLRPLHKIWKAGGDPGTESYPWLSVPSWKNPQNLRIFSSKTSRAAPLIAVEEPRKL